MDSAPDPLPAAPSLSEGRWFRWARRLIDDRPYRRHLFLWVAVLALVAVSSLAVMVETLPPTPFDLQTTLTFQTIDTGLLRLFMVFISMFGYSPWAYLVVIGTLLLVGLWRGWKEAFFLGAVTLAQGGLNHLLKTVVGRPRPVDTLVQVIVPSDGSSFPSGHVMFYTVFFGFLFLLLSFRMSRSPLRRVLQIATGGLVLLVGPSRIYLGAHWVSDVMAAYLLGLVIVMTAAELYLRFFAPSPSSPQATIENLPR